MSPSFFACRIKSTPVVSPFLFHWVGRSALGGEVGLTLCGEVTIRITAVILY
jgi:hypothetical protein